MSYDVMRDGLLLGRFSDDEVTEIRVTFDHGLWVWVMDASGYWRVSETDRSKDEAHTA